LGSRSAHTGRCTGNGAGRRTGPDAGATRSGQLGRHWARHFHSGTLGVTGAALHRRRHTGGRAGRAAWRATRRRRRTHWASLSARNTRGRARQSWGAGWDQHWARHSAKSWARSQPELKAWEELARAGATRRNLVHTGQHRVGTADRPALGAALGPAPEAPGPALGEALGPALGTLPVQPELSWEPHSARH
jgi:hypothetical protein